MGYVDQVAELAQGQHANTAGWVRINCPACESFTGKADFKRACGFNPGTGFVLCFKCGLRGRASGYIGEVHREPSKAEHVPLPPGCWSAWDPAVRDSELLSPALTYLRQRRVAEHVWTAAQIHVCNEGRYCGRVIIPCIGADGFQWGWVARRYLTSKSDAPKYLTAPGMRRDRLWNEAAAFEDTDEPLLVMEGIFDSLPYWPNAVACLGKPGSPQVSFLARTGNTRRPVAVALDGDAVGESMALAWRLEMEGVRAGFVRIPPGEDPGTVDRDWLLEEAKRCI